MEFTKLKKKQTIKKICKVIEEICEETQTFKGKKENAAVLTNEISFFQNNELTYRKYKLLPN